MEYLLIHKPRGMMPPDLAMASVEQAEKLQQNPEEFVPGGKMIASYSALTQRLIVCIWDAPSIEILMPFSEKMSFGGWDTEVIPVEKVVDGIPKWKKAIAEAMKK